ncbi:hypothetical protein MHOL44478_17235 [Mycobacterium holsaticum DSM 44478]|nr:hypothetical protein [Mycolicibacterium holsaticum DSM 44478 = JCM 12374]
MEVGAPRRTVEAGVCAVPVAEHRAGLQCEQVGNALRAAAVQVHRQRGHVAKRSQLAKARRGMDLVDRARQHRQVREPLRGGQHDARVGVGAA